MSTIDVQALPAGMWQVDKVHSSIGFAVDYMAGTFHGTFGDFDAAVTDGVLNGTAKVASVQVKDDNLAAHLQSPDFFDAQAHPELTFTSGGTATAGIKLDPVEENGTLLRAVGPSLPDPANGASYTATIFVVTQPG